MITSDLIKLLSEADPSGKKHVRFRGSGIPIYATSVEGYWDGDYTYIDEKTNQYVFSRKDSKVDLFFIDLGSWIEEHIDIHNNTNNFDSVLNTFRFDNISDERRISLIEQIREEYDQQYRWEKDLYNKALTKAIERSKAGWQFFQKKEVDTNPVYKYYNWKIISPDNSNIMSSSVSDTEPILYGGYWVRKDSSIDTDYYEWVFTQKHI